MAGFDADTDALRTKLDEILTTVDRTADDFFGYRSDDMSARLNDPVYGSLLNEGVRAIGDYINAAPTEEEKAQRQQVVADFVRPESQGWTDDVAALFTPDDLIGTYAARYAERVNENERIAREKSEAVEAAVAAARLEEQGLAAAAVAAAREEERGIAADATAAAVAAAREEERGIAADATAAAVAAAREEERGIAADATAAAVAAAREEVLTATAAPKGDEGVGTAAAIPMTVDPGLAAAAAKAEAALIAGLPGAIDGAVGASATANATLLLDPALAAANAPVVDGPKGSETVGGAVVIPMTVDPGLAAAAAKAEAARALAAEPSVPVVADVPVVANRIDGAAIDATLAEQTFKYSAQESVARLQATLNVIKVEGAVELKVDGDMGGQTRAALAALTPERLLALSPEDREIVKAAVSDVAEIPFEKKSNAKVGELAGAVVKAIDEVGAPKPEVATAEHGAEVSALDVAAPATPVVAATGTAATIR